MRTITQIRLDLQLYRVDAHSYLVDFRNVGYGHVALGDEAAAAAGAGAGGATATAKSLSLRRDVNSPFLFLDATFRLIVELAGGT